MNATAKRVLFYAIAPLLVSIAAAAAEHGTKIEAVAMVKKAIAQIKADGAEKAYAEFDAKPSAFHDRDLYVVVYDKNGKCLAHGSNAQLVGKDMSGIGYIRDRMTLMKSNMPFWQNYEFLDPVTKNIEPKTTYCEPSDDTVVCVGVYQVPAQ